MNVNKEKGSSDLISDMVSKAFSSSSAEIHSGEDSEAFSLRKQDQLKNWQGSRTLERYDERSIWWSGGGQEKGREELIGITHIADDGGKKQYREYPIHRKRMVQFTCRGFLLEMNSDSYFALRNWKTFPSVLA
ncbi:hypothetical protein STEG23_017060 [Scotinomys teguina]